MPHEFAYRELTDIPRLSLKERDRRWAGIRREMALKGLDCLLIFSEGGLEGTANLRYVAHVAVQGVGLFPCNGEPVIFGGLPNTAIYQRGAPCRASTGQLVLHRNSLCRRASRSTCNE